MQEQTTSVRFSKAEKAQLKREAKRLGCAVHYLIRYCMGFEPKPTGKNKKKAG